MSQLVEAGWVSLILIAYGAVCHGNTKRLTTADLPDVPPERFEAWRQARLAAFATVMAVPVGCLVGYAVAACLLRRPISSDAAGFIGIVTAVTTGAHLGRAKQLKQAPPA